MKSQSGFQFHLSRREKIYLFCNLDASTLLIARLQRILEVGFGTKWIDIMWIKLTDKGKLAKSMMHTIRLLQSCEQIFQKQIPLNIQGRKSRWIIRYKTEVIFDMVMQKAEDLIPQSVSTITRFPKLPNMPVIWEKMTKNFSEGNPREKIYTVNY